jgi:hypothetical protein
MRRGWLRRNRLTTTLRHSIPLCGRVVVLVPAPARAPVLLLPARHRAEPENQKPISLVKSPSGGLGLQNAQTARPLLPGAPNRGSSSFFRWDTSRAYTGEYPIPSRTHQATPPLGRPKRKRRNHTDNIGQNDLEALQNPSRRPPTSRCYRLYGFPAPPISRRDEEGFSSCLA